MNQSDECQKNTFLDSHSDPLFLLFNLVYPRRVLSPQRQFQRRRVCQLQGNKENV